MRKNIKIFIKLYIFYILAYSFESYINSKNQNYKDLDQGELAMDTI